MAKTIGEMRGFSIEKVSHPDAVYTIAKDMPAPDLYAGLELEIENWKGLDRVVEAGGRWSLKKDNSLRGEAREIVTLATKMKFLEAILEEIFSKYEVYEEDFSERCSVHVHMNVIDYTMDDLKVFCILYQMVERLLFQFIGHDRKDNIYCVPWYQSGMTHSFLESSKTSVNNWEKYTALNLLPVNDQGTVEFRHMNGTRNVARIVQWLRLISRMHLFAKATTMKQLSDIVLNMNTVSNYEQFLHSVFANDVGVLNVPKFQDLLSVGVVDAKLMFLSPPKKKKEEKKKPMDEIYNLIAEFDEPPPAAGMANARPEPVVAEDHEEPIPWEVRRWGLNEFVWKAIKDDLKREGYSWNSIAGIFVKFDNGRVMSKQIPVVMRAYGYGVGGPAVNVDRIAEERF